MKTRKAIALALISFICLIMLLYGCDSGSAKEPQATKLDSWGNINQEVGRAEGWRQIVKTSAFKEDYPAIDGSTTMVPLAVEFARQHLKLDDEAANAFAQFSTTGVAYEKLCSREIDLFIGTMPGEAELALARQNSVTLVQKPICWDSFVFITHKDNPVDSLSIAQLQGIFSGGIRNWKDIGSTHGDIRAFQRERGAGSQTGMENLVMQGTPMADPATVKVVTGMGALVEAVAEPRDTSFGIGYTYAYYIENLYKNADIKILRVNGVDATDANVVSGAYPLRIERFGVIRKDDEESPGGRFLDWILSAEGQACVKQAGYIPVAAVS